MSSIKIVDDQDQTIEPVSQTLCEICHKQFSNYVCPRCNLRYCSLSCYKDLQHADCTESFYKESVTAEIQNQSVDKQKKIKMLEVLQRLEEEQKMDAINLDDDDDDENDLTQRFSNIDLDNTDPQLIWNLLSDKEREEFQHMLKDFDQSNLYLPSYTPWWEQDSQEWTEEPDLPDFEKMTKPETRSGSHWLWNLLHLVGTYSYLMRHAMGDLLEYPQETLSVCEAISENVLYSTAAACPFNSVGSVVADLVNHITQFEDHTPSAKRNQVQHQRYYDLQLLMLEDIKHLLSVCQRAMHNFWKTLDGMMKINKKNKKRHLLALRKLYFYVAAAAYFIHDQDRLTMIQLAIENEINKTTIEKEGFERDFKAAEDAIKQYQQQQEEKEKVKIEEL